MRTLYSMYVAAVGRWVIDRCVRVAYGLQRVGWQVSNKDEHLELNIHHWIGKECSLDKFGAAAMRAVELNYYLGGSCNIYRELEGGEGEDFLEYFAEDLEYLYGIKQPNTRTTQDHLLTSSLARSRAIFR
jgi:hypothetical protein